MKFDNFRLETAADGIATLTWDMADRSMNVITLAVMARDPRVDKVITTVLGGGMVALSSLAWLGAYVP